MQIYDPSARKAKAGSLCLTDKGERLSQVTQGWPHPHAGVHITCIHIHRSEIRRRACAPLSSYLLSLVLCVPLCPSSHFLQDPRQQKVVIPKMPRKEWACELPHCYVIEDPIHRFVLYSATSEWQRPCQPYVASYSDLHPHPKLCEKATTLLGSKPKIQGG